MKIRSSFLFAFILPVLVFGQLTEISSIMIPIAVASDGSVLCKTEQYIIDSDDDFLYHYGWALISATGEIQIYKYVSQEDYMEAFLQEEMNLALAQTKIPKVLSKYQFRELKESHTVEKEYTYADFIKKYPSLDTYCTQLSLENTKSIAEKPESLYLSYQIGNLLFLRNEFSLDYGKPCHEGDPYEELGSSFHCYRRPTTNNSDRYYEEYFITGLIILDPKTSGEMAFFLDKKEGGRFQNLEIIEWRKEGFGVQIGGYTNTALVLEELKKLDSKWFRKAAVHMGERNNKPYYRIILSPMASKAQAQSYCRNLKSKYQMQDVFVVNLENF